MKAKVLTWDKFREVCYDDAYNWFNGGYSADELTENDIINEYPDDYFTDTTETECNELSSAFTPSDFADKTLEYLEEITMENVKSIIINFIEDEKFFVYYDDSELDLGIFGEEKIDIEMFEKALKEVMTEKGWDFYQARDYSHRKDEYSGIYAETAEDAVRGFKEIDGNGEFLSKEYAEYLLKTGYYENIYEDDDRTWTGDLSENWEEFDPDENEDILTYDEFVKNFGVNYVE